MTDNDVRARIYNEQKNQIEQDMAPFGFITTGLEGDEGFVEEGSVLGVWRHPRRCIIYVEYLMDVEDLFDLDTVLFKQRKCRSCGKTKDLTTDFYRSRPDRTSLSAWSYECKDCTKERVK